MGPWLRSHDDLWEARRASVTPIATAHRTAIARTPKSPTFLPYSTVPVTQSPAVSLNLGTNVSEVRGGRLEHLQNTVVIFDATHGSLRLTEPVFIRFEHLLDRLARSVELSEKHDSLLSLETVERLKEWYEGLDDESELDVSVAGESVVREDGWIHVFDHGSVVGHRDSKGVFHDIEIGGYQLMQMGDGLQLVYTYQGNDYTGEPFAKFPRQRELETGQAGRG